MSVALEALARSIAQCRQEQSQTVPERPPVGESHSNGIIECTVGLVACQVRPLKVALGNRIVIRVPSEARIPCWLVEFAAILDEQVCHWQRREDAAPETAWTERQHPNHRVGVEDLVHARQANEGRKMGPKVPP